MRTLVQTLLRPTTPTVQVDSYVKDWLESSGFRPQAVTLSGAVQADLLKSDDFPANAPDNLATRHVIDIVLAIPRFDQERYYALSTAKFLIHFEDPVHATTVWGLVCIDAPSVIIRWRHRVSKSLEHATKALVDKVWLNSGPDKMFEPFSSGQNIPVREPRSTTDAYVGEILPPGPRIRERARADRRTELRIVNVAAGVTLLSLVVGFALFIISDPNGNLRWVSSFFDRLATTAAMTGAVSYLSYYFHFRDLQRKPTVDWK